MQCKGREALNYEVRDEANVTPSDRLDVSDGLKEWNLYGVDGNRRQVTCQKIKWRQMNK